LSTGSGFNTTRWATWDTYPAMKVLVGDFNGDGRTDVMKIDVGGGRPGQNGLWVGLSTGSGFNTTRWATWDTYSAMKVLVGDFNGDGRTDVVKIDVAQRNAERGLWVGLSTSSSFFTTRWVNWITYPAILVLTGDFNGDRRDDLLKIDIGSPA